MRGELGSFCNQSGPLACSARVRADQPRAGRELQRGAVRDLGHPPGGAALGCQFEPAGLMEHDRAAGHDRQQEPDAERHRFAEGREPAAAGEQRPPVDEQEQHCRDDHDQADLTNRHRDTEDQPGADRGEPRDGRLPQHYHERGDDQRLEHHVRHDRRFGLKLIGIEQDRCHRQRGEPAVNAAADQQDVQRSRHRKPQQVLDHRDSTQVPDGHDDLDGDLVADRVRAHPGVVEVFDRVDVQQGRVVGHLRDHPQHQAGCQQQRCQPVAAQNRNDPAGPGLASVRLGRAVLPRTVLRGADDFGTQRLSGYWSGRPGRAGRRGHAVMSRG